MRLWCWQPPHHPHPRGFWSPGGVGSVFLARFGAPPRAPRPADTRWCCRSLGCARMGMGDVDGDWDFGGGETGSEAEPPHSCPQTPQLTPPAASRKGSWSCPGARSPCQRVRAVLIWSKFVGFLPYTSFWHPRVGAGLGCGRTESWRTAPSWWLRWEKDWEEVISPAQQVEKLRHGPVWVCRGCR